MIVLCMLEAPSGPLGLFAVTMLAGSVMSAYITQVPWRPTRLQGRLLPLCRWINTVRRICRHDFLVGFAISDGLRDAQAVMAAARPDQRKCLREASCQQNGMDLTIAPPGYSAVCLYPGAGKPGADAHHAGAANNQPK